MPVYQFDDQHYDLPDGLTNEQAISKIKTHLGQSEGESQMATVGNVAKGVGTAAMDIVGGIPGFLAGLGTGVATAVGHQDPQGGLALAKDIMEKSTPSHALGIDVKDNKGYEYAMKPLEWFSQALGFSASGYGEIAKVLGASEEAVKNVNSTAELAMLAGTAGLGGKKAAKALENKPTSSTNPLASLSESYKTAPENVPTAVDGGAGAFQAITDKLGYQEGAASPLNRPTPMNAMASELAASGERQRGAAADQSIASRDTAMQQEVAKQTGLDFNAAERARQEAAPTGAVEARQADAARIASERDASLSKGLEEQRTQGVQGELDVGNTNRPYTDMLADDGKGGSRPLSANEYVDTLTNLEKKEGTRFKMPEDLDASYQHYLDTVSGKQAGLFDVASHVNDFNTTKFVEQIPRLVDEHPSVRNAEKLLERQEKFTASLKEQVAKGETKASALISETRALKEARDKVEQVRSKVEGDLVANKQETAGLSEGKRGWANGPKELNARSRKQAGVVNPEVFKAGFEKVKELANGVRLRAFSHGDSLTIKMTKDGKDLGGALYEKTNKYDSPASTDLAATATGINKDARGQGLSKELYKFAAELGNDVVPSKVRTEAGSAMWNSFEKSGLSENKKIVAAPPPYIPGKLVAKSQRGGLYIGDKKTSTVDKFKETMDTLVPEKLSPEAFVEKFKGTPDLQQNIVQKAANYGMKGGTYMALKTKNPLVAHVVDRFLEANNNARAAIASQIHDYLAPAGRALSDKAKVEIFTAQQVAERLGKPLTSADLAKHGFSEAQIHWAEAHKEVMGDMMGRVNDSLVAAGHSPIDPKIAYVSTRMMGQFRRMVLDSEKNVIGMLTADNRFALDKQVKQYEALGKDHIIGEENYYGGRNNKEGLPKDLDQILDFLSKDDPKTKEFVENIKQMSSDDAYNYMNAKSHTMGKKGVFGTEGNKLFLGKKKDSLNSERDQLNHDTKIKEWNQKNAVEGMQAQIDYAEKVIQWSELSKAVADTKEVMSPSSGLDMPNARSYLKDYIDNALGNNPTKMGSALQTLTSTLGETTGLGTKQPTSVVSAIKQSVNGILLGANPLFLATQFIQPFKSMPGTMAWLESRGLKKNFDFGTGYSYLMDAGLDIAKEARGTIKDPVMKGAIDFAADNHVYTSDLFDSNNSVKGTVGGAVSKGLQYGTGQLEQFTRKATYFAFVKMMNENGIKPENGLYKAAQKLTDIAMNNYSPIESPMGYNALGPAGRVASNLTSYKMNELSRISLITRDSVSGILKDGDLGKPFLTELMSQVAFGGLKGTILYAEANEIVKLISDKMGTPTSLTKLLLDSKIPSYITHGMFAAAGGDMSQRLGMSIVPGSIADTIMPGASKIGAVAKAGYDAVTKPSEYNTKNALREIAPGGAAGIMDRTWFSGKDASGNELSMNRNKVFANATRNEADKVWKTLGGTGLNESIQKEKEYVNSDIDKRYMDKRTTVLNKMKQDFFTDGKFNRNSIDKYIKYQGDPSTLEKDLQNIALEQNVPSPKLALFRAAANNSITNAHKLMRRTGKE